MNNKKLEKMLVEYKESEKFQTLDNGTKDLLRFYFSSKHRSNISNMLVVDDIVWDSDFESFVKALKKYRVKELVFGSTWSSAIQLEMYLIDNGYEVDGTIVYYEDDFLGRKEIKKGIKMVLK